MRPPDMPAVDHLFAKLREEEGADADELIAGRVSALLSTATRKQALFLEDRSSRKSLLTPRRSGKTWAFMLEHIRDLLLVPGYQGAYVTMTRTQSKRNVWPHLLQMNEAYQLGLKFHHTELTVKGPGQSMLWLGGAMTPKDVERYRGLSLDRATVDETGSFEAGLLHDLLEEVLKYTLLDRQGQLEIGGTPGAVLAGQFWDATDEPAFKVKETPDGKKYSVSRPYCSRNHPKWRDVAYVWSHHGWGMQENTALPNLWNDALAEHRRQGNDDQDPTWIREGLGRWAPDGSAFVYRYEERKNGWHPRCTPSNRWGLPEAHDWRFIAGVDLGYDDAFSIQVIAWSSNSSKFFHVYGFSEAEMSVSDMANKIKETESLFGRFDAIVGDTGGLGKAIFEEMRRNHGIVIFPARKTDKRDHIEILNSELRSGRACIIAESTLAKQMKTLQWKDPRTKREEHPKQPNDACDAFLYVVRYSLHHYAREFNSEPEKGSPEWWRKIEAEEERRAELQARGDDADRVLRIGENLDTRYGRISRNATLARLLK